YRCSLRHSYTKLSAGSDMETQLIIAVVIRHNTVSHEIRYFPQMLERVLSFARPWIFVLDAGYDAEWVHQSIRDHDMLSMIPARRYQGRSAYRTRGRYRKQMRRAFDDTLYHQRNKCETIFSVIKRRFGSEIMARNGIMMTRELLYRVLAYNCHRMCVISCLLWMVSRQPKKHHKQERFILYVNKHELNKLLLDKFTLEQLHDLCKTYKREMNQMDYRDRIILGESNPEIIKKRFIPYIVGFFDQLEIIEYAKKCNIRTD
ncbi:MAG: transposase, partial [Nitrosotalea sp.]